MQAYLSGLVQTTLAQLLHALEELQVLDPYHNTSSSKVQQVTRQIILNPELLPLTGGSGMQGAAATTDYQFQHSDSALLVYAAGRSDGGASGGRLAGAIDAAVGMERYSLQGMLLQPGLLKLPFSVLCYRQVNRHQQQLQEVVELWRERQLQQREIQQSSSHEWQQQQTSGLVGRGVCGDVTMLEEGWVDVEGGEELWEGLGGEDNVEMDEVLGQGGGEQHRAAAAGRACGGFSCCNPFLDPLLGEVLPPVLLELVLQYSSEYAGDVLQLVAAEKLGVEGGIQPQVLQLLLACLTADGEEGWGAPRGGAGGVGATGSGVCEGAAAAAAAGGGGGGGRAREGGGVAVGTAGARSVSSHPLLCHALLWRNSRAVNALVNLTRSIEAQRPGCAYGVGEAVMEDVATAAAVGSAGATPATARSGVARGSLNSSSSGSPIVKLCLMVHNYWVVGGSVFSKLPTHDAAAAVSATAAGGDNGNSWVSNWAAALEDVLSSWRELGDLVPGDAAGLAANLTLMKDITAWAAAAAVAGAEALAPAGIPAQGSTAELVAGKGRGDQGLRHSSSGTSSRLVCDTAAAFEVQAMDMMRQLGEAMVEGGGSFSSNVKNCQLVVGVIEGLAAAAAAGAVGGGGSGPTSSSAEGLRQSSSRGRNGRSDTEKALDRAASGGSDSVLLLEPEQKRPRLAEMSATASGVGADQDKELLPGMPSKEQLLARVLKTLARARTHQQQQQQQYLPESVTRWLSHQVLQHHSSSSAMLPAVLLLLEGCGYTSALEVMEDMQVMQNPARGGSRVLGFMEEALGGAAGATGAGAGTAGGMGGGAVGMNTAAVEQSLADSPGVALLSTAMEVLWFRGWDCLCLNIRAESAEGRAEVDGGAAVARGARSAAVGMGRGGHGSSASRATGRLSVGLVRKALQVLVSSHVSHVQLAAACAFLRAMMTQLAQHLQGVLTAAAAGSAIGTLQPGQAGAITIAVQQLPPHLLELLQPVFALSTSSSSSSSSGTTLAADRCHALHIYFLKQLHKQGFSMIQIQHFCQHQQQQLMASTSALLPALSLLPWPSSTSPLPFDPFSYLPGYRELLQTFAAAVERGGSCLGVAGAAAAEAAGDVARHEALLAAVASVLHLRRGGAAGSSSGRGTGPGEHINDLARVLRERLVALQLPSRVKGLLLGLLSDPMLGNSSSSNEVDNAAGCSTRGLAALFSQLTNSTSSRQNSSVSYKGSSEVALLSLCLHAAIKAACRRTPALFSSYLDLSPHLRAQFLPAMASDEAMEAYRAVTPAEGEITRYRCSCGYIYLVGECGQPTETKQCPNCKTAMLGGPNHGVNTGQQMLGRGDTGGADAPGYVLPGRMDLNLRVRGLGPAAAHVVHMLTHLLLAAGELLLQPQQQCSGSRRNNSNNSLEVLLTQARGVTGSSSSSSGSAAGSAVAHVVTIAAACWEQLKQCLGTSEEAAVAVGHSIIRNLQQQQQQQQSSFPQQLSSSAQRLVWEQTFSDLAVAPAIARPQHMLQQMVGEGQGGSSGCGGSSTTGCEVLELLPARMVEDAAFRNSNLLLLFRNIQLPTLQLVRTLISNGSYSSANGSGCQQQLLLELLGVLQPDHPLLLLAQLPVLVGWCRLVQEQLGYTISRRQAQQLTIAQVMQQYGEGSDRGSAAALSAALPSFMEAWNSCRHVADGYRCTAFAGGIPQLTEESAFSLCCIGQQDDGVYLRAMIEQLVLMQNGWLDRIHHLRRPEQQQQQEREEAAQVAVAADEGEAAGAAGAAPKDVTGLQQSPEAPAGSAGDPGGRLAAEHGSVGAVATTAEAAVAGGDNADGAAAAAGVPAAAHGGQEGAPSSLAVHQVTSSDIVNLNGLHSQLEQLLLSEGFACPLLQYGAGGALQVDLPALVEWLLQQLVAGKQRLSAGALPDFCYCQEIFRSLATLLHDVAVKVPQQPLTEEQLRGLGLTSSSSSSRVSTGNSGGGSGNHVPGQQQRQQQLFLPLPQASSLKGALEVVLSLVVKSGADPRQLLSEYAAAWLPGGEVRQQLLGSQCSKALQQLPMRNLVAAYEALEDVLVPAALPAVHQDYRVAMPEEVKGKLLLFLGYKGAANGSSLHMGHVLSRGAEAGGGGDGVGSAAAAAGVSPRVFATMLGRFISRFLCSHAAYHPGCTPLKLYLADERCVQWPAARGNSSSSSSGRCGGGGSESRASGDEGQVGSRSFGDLDTQQWVEEQFPDDVLLAHAAACLEVATQAPGQASAAT